MNVQLGNAVALAGPVRALVAAEARLQLSGRRPASGIATDRRAILSPMAAPLRAAAIPALPSNGIPT